MADHDLNQSFEALREAVRHEAVPPAAADIRGRAEHQIRVRRTATVLVAAAVVAAVAIGGASVLRDTAHRTPPPPGSTVAPTPSEPVLAEDNDPRPTRPVLPYKVAPVNDPIAKVKWNQARITVPPHKGCPSGQLTFRAEQNVGGAAAYAPTSYPRILLSTHRIAYGDVTGDGRPEAVLDALCMGDAEDSGDGQGQLLVVTRNGSTLTALGWVGPRGGVFTGYWVDGGHVVTDVQPWHTGFGYELGTVKAYRWTGSAFREVDRSADFPPVAGATIDFAPVAGRSGCPAASVAFDAAGRASVAGRGWNLDQPRSSGVFAPNLLDLDGSGRRWLVVAVACEPAGGESGRSFIAVLTRSAEGGWRAVDAIPAPEDLTIGGWEFRRGALMVSFDNPDHSGEGHTYTWNGEYFQR